MFESDHQRVAGWLALTLQHRCGRLRGCPVEVGISDAGAVTLVWRGGPLACDVADTLADATDPSMPVVQAATPSDLRADLLVGDVPVVLMAYYPDPTVRPELPGDPKGWSWPDPLCDDGAARDSVLWHLAPDPGGVGEATVVRLPTHVQHPRPEGCWTETAHLVVHTEHSLPTYATPQKRDTWEYANELAAIRLRHASPGWTVADADGWLATELADSRRPTPRVAAVLMDDRCLMRLSIGLRIEALAQDRPLSAPWGIVPTAVLSSLCRPDERKHPPATLLLREFGNAYGEHRFTLATNLAVPTLL